jgi:hypothetical protein
MTATRTRRILSPDARLRLLRRARVVLSAALEQPGVAPEDHAATLEHAARALAEHGLAATSTNLDEYIEEGDLLDALEGGADIDAFVDLDRFYGTREEAREWFTARLERGMRHLERRIAGA